MPRVWFIWNYSLEKCISKKCMQANENEIIFFLEFYFHVPVQISVFFLLSHVMWNYSHFFTTFRVLQTFFYFASNNETEKKVILNFGDFDLLPTHTYTLTDTLGSQWSMPALEINIFPFLILINTLRCYINDQKKIFTHPSIEIATFKS